MKGGDLVANTRREMAEKVFTYIRSVGFKPINIQYGNGYFVFDMGEDGVVHFNIKGLHGWKFGMWINEEDPVVSFFCQHKLNIDKFKPSRSFFSANFNKEDISSEDSWMLYKIKDILRMIKRHPLVAFTMDYNESEFSSESYLGVYLERFFYKIQYTVRQHVRWIIPVIWHKPKIAFLNLYKVVDYVTFDDCNSDGWIANPRYEMSIHFKRMYQDEEKQTKAEIGVINTWFKKDRYKELHINCRRPDVKGFYWYFDDNN